MSTLPVTKYLIFCLLLVGLSMCSADRISPAFPPTGVTDHHCPGTTGQTCSDDETCCELGPDDTICCQNTTVPSSTCCGDGCCTDYETCCKDSKGVSCCLQQSSYCVAEAYPYPARCCPRWTVACAVGSVGCCDPAQPWQWTIQSSSSEPRARLGQPVLKPNQPSTRTSLDVSDAQDEAASVSAGAGATVYALFEGGLLGLQLLHIDPTTGNVQSKVRVHDLDDNPAGESTREFLFDEKRKAFYYLDANFTANAGVRPSSGRPIYLYTVNAETGDKTKLVVSGAVDYPTGQALCGDQIVMATNTWNSAGSQITGYAFYSLDPTSGKATSLGSIARGVSEDADGFYAGYHRACSADQKQVYRLGYKKVTAQTEQGIDVVSLAGSSSSVKWQDEVSPGHDYYMSIDTLGDSILSLAPNKTDAKRGLDLVKWSLDGSAPTVVASLGNAHPPRVSELGDLGYFGTYVSAAQSQYVAMVVSESTLPALDAWALAVVDMSSGKYTVTPLSPRLLAGSNGMSGLGLA